jgi:hypothetical protein
MVTIRASSAQTKKAQADKASEVEATKKKISSVRLNQQQNFQILLDIESFRVIYWKDLLKIKPEFYNVAGPLKTSFRNRFNYLKDLKEAKPAKYWELFGKASDRVQEYLAGQQGADDEDEDDEDEDDEDDDDDEDDEDQDRKSQASTAVSSLTASILLPKKINKRMAPATVSVGSAKKSASVSGSAKKASKKSSASVASTKFASPSVTGKRHTQFDKLEAAITFADEVIYINFDFPEKNGGPLFWVQEITECKNASKKELFSKLVIRLNSVLDLSDAHEIYGWNICGGKGFLLRLPWVPSFLLTKYKEMFAMEENKCNRTRDKHATAAIAIIKSEDPINDLAPRRWKHVLFIYPDGKVCTTELTSDTHPVSDQKQEVSLRRLQCMTEVGAGDGKEDYEQLFFPAYFSLRIIDDDAENELEIGDRKKEGRSLNDLFSGMSVKGEKGDEDMSEDGGEDSSEGGSDSSSFDD